MTDEELIRLRKKIHAGQSLSRQETWKALDAIITLRTEIARMKDVLKPFADRADRYDPPEHDDEDVDWDTSAPRLRVKHLRTAREVLKGDTHE